MYPILAIDYGQKHLGVAISDSKGIVASPLSTLSITKNRNHEDLIQDIISLVQEYKVKSILLGYPQVFEEEHNQNTKRIDKFKTLLEKTNLSILTWDESFSTATAKNMLISSNKHFKKNKSKIDSLAASVFLQEYLNSKQ